MTTKKTALAYLAAELALRAQPAYENVEPR
jgi:hypothetical protein